MLVLSRKQNERIRVGADVAITIVEIRGDKVRLGIEAPRTIPVHREEVWLRLHQPETSNNTTEEPKQ